MIGTIAITDEAWYRFLLAHSGIEEINFWTPSARRRFNAPEFSPFLFKLRAPANAICGFAYFAQYSGLPDWLAWDLFGLGNGCESYDSMRGRIDRIRERIRFKAGPGSEQIGCIQLVAPVFLPERLWIPQPTDWRPRTQSSTRYDLSRGEGRRVWDACQRAAAELNAAEVSSRQWPTGDPGSRHGAPVLIQPRRGQATFRAAILDAYGRACAVTEEHSLPALEAAHIRPFEVDGPHEISNGLLLRADIHRLFDRGYITVSHDLRLVVGERLRKEYRNGHSYYPHHGKPLRVPERPEMKPSEQFLVWHRRHRFVG